ncbi:hypothetical protein [Psittacicella hinzii]|uniref:Uncharacterized protein n=1 Tax=Psittacicella hinzii TaxID=2028575 RepID=A0A3A1YMF2_9GAMM|nr:hypothetical protein [Psittacicella hinzii]RIY39473.1 hypothetical protein CKF58_02090 [Psittacicella hinzii]
MSETYTYWYDPVTNELYEVDGFRAPTIDCVKITADDYAYYKYREDDVQPDEKGYPSIVFNPFGGEDFAHWDREKQEFVQDKEELELYTAYRRNELRFVGYQAAMNLVSEQAEANRLTFIEQLFTRTLLRECELYAKGNLPTNSELEKYCLLNEVSIEDKVEEILKEQARVNELAQAAYYFRTYIDKRVLEIDVTDNEAYSLLMQELSNFKLDFILEVYRIGLEEKTQQRAK